MNPFQEWSNENVGFGLLWQTAISGDRHRASQRQNAAFQRTQQRTQTRALQEQRRTALSQLRAQADQARAAEKTAASEEERLELEKKRFEAEEQERALRNHREGRVRELRRVIVEVEVEMEMLESTDADLCAKLALQLARVKYLEQNNDYLSDLEDIKALKKLRVALDKLISKFRADDIISVEIDSESQTIFVSFNSLVEKCESRIQQIHDEISDLNKQCHDMLIPEASGKSWDAMKSSIDSIDTSLKSAQTEVGQFLDDCVWSEEGVYSDYLKSWYYDVLMGSDDQYDNEDTFDSIDGAISLADTLSETESGYRQFAVGTGPVHSALLDELDKLGRYLDSNERARMSDEIKRQIEAEEKRKAEEKAQQEAEEEAARKAEEEYRLKKEKTQRQNDELAGRILAEIVSSKLRISGFFSSSPIPVEKIKPDLRLSRDMVVDSDYRYFLSQVSTEFHDRTKVLFFLTKEYNDPKSPGYNNELLLEKQFDTYGKMLEYVKKSVRKNTGGISVKGFGTIFDN